MPYRIAIVLGMTEQRNTSMNRRRIPIPFPIPNVGSGETKYDKQKKTYQSESGPTANEYWKKKIINK